MATEHNIDEYEPAEAALKAVKPKLTKAQREFFGAFAHNAVENVLIPLLELKGVELNAEQAKAVMAQIDLKDLTQAIGEGFLSQIDFKTITKVDRFMKSEDFVNVITASTMVNAAVESELVQIIAPLLPSDEPAQEAQ